MEFSGLHCSGCGSSEVEFRADTRKLICHQCGKEEYYSRATLNKNGKVILAKDNAIKFYLSGNLESAYHYALEVLNIFVDNVPAKYIVSYYDEVKNAKYYSIKEFFASAKEIALEFNEVRDLQKLIIASSKMIIDYEMEIIEIFTANMQADSDRRDLSEFIDKICPYCIKNRRTVDFLKGKGFDYYKELVSNLDIPKTCYALIKAIDENPDSPQPTNTFHLISKTRYFYDNYVLPVGDIVRNMRESEYKSKLVMAYEQKLSKYNDVFK